MLVKHRNFSLMYFEDDPRILISKIHYDFAKVGAFKSQEIWKHLRITDFYEGERKIKDHEFQTIEMKKPETPFFVGSRLYKIWQDHFLNNELHVILKRRNIEIREQSSFFNYGTKIFLRGP